MGWTNYHSHSSYCDGKLFPEDYIKAAILAKMPVYGFSSHHPLPFPCKWSMDKAHFPQYIQDIKALKHKYRGKIEIYTGLEIDYIHNVIGPTNSSLDLNSLDFTIGSIHFLGPNSKGEYIEIDGDHNTFLRALNEIFEGDIKALIHNYFENIRKMVLYSPPDIVGHLDKIKIQSVNNDLFSENDTFYIEEVEKTLDVIAASNGIIEVNTRGIYTGKSVSTYPSPWILEKIRSTDIPIMLNSDAHRPEEILASYEASAQMLIQLGFDRVSIYKNNQWQEVGFDLNGLQT